MMKVSRKKLESLMVKRNIGNKDLAIKAGFKVSTLSEILRKERCRIDTAGKICEALECEPEEIMPD